MKTGTPDIMGKTISLAGIRAQVFKMVMHGAQAASGVLSERPRLRFRSRSARFLLLIQLDRERRQAARNAIASEGFDPAEALHTLMGGEPEALRAPREEGEPSTPALSM